jgi:molybdopterin-containing oxidoreductase family molybdopterin binding subunit
MELTRHVLEGSEDPLLKGITIEKLLENNGLMELNVPSSAPLIRFQDQKYASGSGKLELYYENMLDYNQAFPQFEAPQEAYVGNPMSNQYPLQFSQPKCKYYIHTQFYDATWIQQFVKPCIEINPTDAESRGLQNGDLVEAYNDRGSFVCELKVNPAVRPGHSLSREGVWPKFMEKGCVQEVTNGYLNPRQFGYAVGPVTPFNDTLIEVRKHTVSDSERGAS